MPDIRNEVIARKVLPIIYVLDTSGSMYGERIAAVNEAMNETMEVLKDVSAHNPDAEIKIGVLQFSTNAYWVTNGLIDTEDFFWNDLTAGGTTEISAALSALNEKLSRSEFLVSDTGFCLPVIIFMSDGAPTDPGIWEKKLQWVKDNNKWFKHATKITIAIGDDADKECLAKIAGNTECVVEVNDMETLKKLIRIVSATASLIGSKSRVSAAGDSGADIMAQVHNAMNDDENVQIGVDDDSIVIPQDNPQDNNDGDGGWGDEEDW